MYMLLIQVGMAFWAWRKGWKQWAFAPPAATLVLGWVLSGILSTLGLYGIVAAVLAFLLDMSGIVVLYKMIRRSQKQEPQAGQPQSLPNETIAPQVAETAKVATH